VKIAVEGGRFTLVPATLFEEEDRLLYLDKTARNEPLGYSLGHDVLDFNDARLVYARGKELSAVLCNYFPSGEMFDKTTALLQGWRQQSKEMEGDKVFVQVEGRQFIIAYFKGAELIFANRFPIVTSGDFLYYVLMTYDRFELKPENTPAILSGDIMEESEMYKKLYRYIRHIQFIPSQGFFDFPEAFQSMANYQHFDLFSLKLCG
jgi:hypothetical protein